MSRIDLALEEWVYGPELVDPELPEDIGLEYEPPRRSGLRITQITTLPVEPRHCATCGTDLTEDIPLNQRTCSKACSLVYRREYTRVHRSRRFTYACKGCAEVHEVGHSMWEEVRARGTVCAKCHAASAPDRGLILSDNRTFRVRPAPCGKCAHGYAEPAAYAGYACRANARECVPYIYAKLFSPVSTRGGRG